MKHNDSFSALHDRERRVELERWYELLLLGACLGAWSWSSKAVSSGNVQLKRRRGLLLHLEELNAVHCPNWPGD